MQLVTGNWALNIQFVAYLIQGTKSSEVITSRTLTFHFRMHNNHETQDTRQETYEIASCDVERKGGKFW
jgi:hypothetical protein